MNHISTRLALITILIFTAACATKIPVRALQLADDDGKNRAPITAAEVTVWINKANETWAKRGYKFVFDEEKDFQQINSTVLNSQPPDGDNASWDYYKTVGNFVSSLLPSTHINVLFRDRGGAGWSWGPGDTDFVSMPSYTNTCISKPTPGKACPNGCCPNDTLLSHEIGHYLGLAHTFTGTKCNQVNLSNTDGDRYGQLGNDASDDVADTNPDPSAACAPTSSLSCAGGSVMVNGVTFVPPWTNIMSYHDCLPEKITKGQKAVIKRSLKQASRKGLVD